MRFFLFYPCKYDFLNIESIDDAIFFFINNGIFLYKNIKIFDKYTLKIYNFEFNIQDYPINELNKIYYLGTPLQKCILETYFKIDPSY